MTKQKSMKQQLADKAAAAPDNLAEKVAQQVDGSKTDKPSNEQQEVAPEPTLEQLHKELEEAKQKLKNMGTTKGMLKCPKQDRYQGATYNYALKMRKSTYDKFENLSTGAMSSAVNYILKRGWEVVEKQLAKGDIDLRDLD